mmetsp:Transcript_44810/g.71599  ORF Transcript_44810/g.71599 Transcript_44810/m.71599 type:complete len:219 (-) Transcript_44810:203-859(-)
MDVLHPRCSIARCIVGLVLLERVARKDSALGHIACFGASVCFYSISIRIVSWLLWSFLLLGGLDRKELGVHCAHILWICLGGCFCPACLSWLWIANHKHLSTRPGGVSQPCGPDPADADELHTIRVLPTGSCLSAADLFLVHRILWLDVLQLRSFFHRESFMGDRSAQFMLARIRKWLTRKSQSTGRTLWLVVRRGVHLDGRSGSTPRLLCSGGDACG